MESLRGCHCTSGGVTVALTISGLKDNGSSRSTVPPKSALCSRSRYLISHAVLAAEQNAINNGIRAAKASQVQDRRDSFNPCASDFVNA